MLDEWLSADGTKIAGSFSPPISDDAIQVTFDSQATNLVEADTFGFEDVFERDVMAGSTIRASIPSAVRHTAPHRLQPLLVRYARRGARERSPE
jgi:hypothetical protein